MHSSKVREVVSAVDAKINEYIPYRTIEGGKLYDAPGGKFLMQEKLGTSEPAPDHGIWKWGLYDPGWSYN